MNPLALPPPSPLRKIHVVFKTHLDVGFTDFAARVVRAYFDHHIPRSLALARALRLAGGEYRFIWTTGSWLISAYLEQAAAAERAQMEAAIAAGDIVWHGLPFTTHSELMDAGFFRFGLSLSAELDHRFGRHTLAAKLSDVPGQTIAIVPLMAEAGLQFLHIGVNAASTPPSTPPVFLWRNPQGGECVVMYDHGSYGGLKLVPGLDEALYFAHTGDNLGPQTPEEIHSIFDRLRRSFPGVSVEASTLDAFASQLLSIKDSLTVITQEIGDTWIHGGASDPGKMSAFRTLLRLRTAWLESRHVDPAAAAFKAFSRCLLLVPEHTWGLDVKTHLKDSSTYAPAKFRAARSGEDFQKLELSWAEQRAYLDQAVQVLDANLAAEARQALAEAAPARPDLAQWGSPVDPAGLYELPLFRLRFDPASGAIVTLQERQSGRHWASPRQPLGRLCYETFSQADYDRFYRQYIRVKKVDEWWAVPDFTKPGMAAAGAQHSLTMPPLTALYRCSDDRADHFLCCMEAPPSAWQEAGCPRLFYLQVSVSKTAPEIGLDLHWFEKQPNRLPEALWFSFVPPVARSGRWTLLKLGQAIPPANVIQNGSRHLHAVTPGVIYQDETACLSVDSLDTALVAPGQPSLLNFNNRQPSQHQGMHFLLYNNVWGTNFPMWSGADARFRFVLRFNRQSVDHLPHGDNQQDQF
ncbi:MAG TPA: DUF5054 domain-containing protein [Anaerolineaceae bacterium]|nr:DUF5054 domain-containing protein [Anaerolineaceae bacterium]HPN54017.1 DUF5054 domain-containing protein [Anaerolineaceae bacterium]